MNRYDRKYLKREETAARRQKLQELLTEVASEAETARAQAVRSLCPCRGPWPDSVWAHIAAACEDPSPRVRLEALHVLQDTHTAPHPNAYRLLHKACEDPDPLVAARAKDYLRGLRLQETRRKERGKG